MSKTKAPIPSSSLTEGFRVILLGATSALIVVAPLVASEGAARTGATVALSTIWLLLLLAFSLWALRQKTWTLHFCGVDAALLGMVSLVAISGLMMASQGNARYSINALWQWVAMGAGFFLIRQLLRTPAEQRAIWLVMVALAASLAGHGLVQYGHTFPQRRAYYWDSSEADKQDILLTQGVDPAPLSTMRRHFEDRLGGVEPTASFALANSLAGLLAPGLIAALALALAMLGNRTLRAPAATVLGLMLLALAFCLLLTKSRTGYLAAGLGGLLLWIYDWRTDRRLGWKMPLVIFSLALTLLVGGVAVGGIDVQVLTEARMSLAYRLEYWSSALAMIGDHPLWGCGGGNFQDYYTDYKLPQASEEISDPHNFVLEIWATAGAGAFLALGAAGVLLIRRLRAAADDRNKDAEPAPSGSRRAVYFGALGGVLLAPLIGLLAGRPLELLGPLPVIWLVGIPLGAAVMVALDPWAARGRLPLALPAIALTVLLVNLLFAGGISFVGVVQTVWLLLAMSINISRPSAVVVSRRLGVGVTLASLALLAGCLLTAYMPVLTSAALVAQGHRHLSSNQRNYNEAYASFVAAARADDRSAEPWRLRGESLLAHWRVVDKKERFAARTLQRLQAALDQISKQLLLRDSHSSSSHRQVGRWRLELFRATGDMNELHKAAKSYRHAVRLYPHSSFARAQLAWVVYLLGETSEAALEADEAARLDDLNPHYELQLQERRLYDPGPLGPAAKGTLPGPGGRTAAEIVEFLRQGDSAAEDAGK